MVVRIGMPIIAALLAAAAPRALAARELRLLALDDSNALVRFDPTRPDEATITEVRGVSGTLVGIDVRPANRLVYGISTANDVYTIDPTSGVARVISTLTLPFDAGPRSGIDFNPQTDRLRLLGGNGQNLRVQVDLGAAAADAPLRYAATDVNSGRRPAIVAAAYTNAVANAPATKLYDIDGDVDVLALQDPPNDGVLVTVGSLGADFGPLAGFDIVSEQGIDRAFAVSGATLYQIDLASGAARALGTVGASARRNLVGLTVLPDADGSRN